MNKDTLNQYLLEGYSTYKIAELTNKSQTTIRYWIKKYDLNKPIQTISSTKICRDCNSEKPIEDFYFKNKSKSDLRDTRCKICAVKSSVKRFQEIKKQCVDYKGGSCEVCGYNKCQAALDFHHTDPSEKDFQISSVKNTKLSPAVYAELDKCKLLCANCHREEHYNTGDLYGI